MEKIELQLVYLEHGKGLDLPTYQSPGAAGFDLYAALSPEETLIVNPLERVLVPTGVSMAIPEGYEGQIRPRSGLASKNGITCLNTPGTIDSDYRGEIKVLLINLGQEMFIIERAMRIAQMVIAPVRQAKISVIDTLPITQRGEKGFGSTGH